MSFWTILFLLLNAVYALFACAVWLAWRRIRVPVAAPAIASFPRLSVVIAVRNEAENILHLLGDLGVQSYPREQFEVVIVDDHSTDDTAAVVAQFAAQSAFSIRLLSLQDYLPVAPPDGSYKKKAIEYAVSTVRAAWIVLTDGDCRVGEGWLSSIARATTHTEAKFISGPVTFYAEQTAFEKMQTVEFASLIGSGAATLQWGLPTMCNAANVAFAKEAFESVGGYAGTASTATGDDLFLMHKVHAFYPGQVTFWKEPASIVRTRAKATWRAFYQQRKRWASKWKLYRDWRISALAIFIFMANLALLGGFIGLVLGHVTLSWLLVGLLLRFGPEFMLLSAVLRFLGKTKRIPWILPVQGVYFLYVVFFGIMAQKPGYVWKGRKLS